MKAAVEHASFLARNGNGAYARMGESTSVKKNFIAPEGGMPLIARSRNDSLHGFGPTAWYIIIDAPRMKPMPCGPRVVSEDFVYMMAMFSASWS